MKYMGSKSRIAKDIVPIIQSYITKDTNGYLEPFCLSKDTILFTKNGIKELKDIKIGDEILSDSGEYTTIINKIKSPNTKGKYIKVKGNADIKATYNHLFYINDNEPIQVKDLKIKDSLCIGYSNNNSNKDIDLSEYITISKNIKKGRSGKLIGDDKIKLYHNAPITNRFIPITKELMRCYGLVVAEGDKGNITMHKDEIYYLKEFVTNYESITGLEENNKKYNFKKNACQLSVPYKTIYEKIFFLAMGIGYGARNKNISFLFSLSSDMVLEALRYMYIGDGCCVKRKKYRSLNYKTSSRTLAYQMQALLSIKFGIKSTISYGINKERIIEGRKLYPTNYYNILVTRDKDIEKLTSISNNEILIKENTNKYIITDIFDIEDEFYDITIDNQSHKFIINGGIVTHNCGGANVIDKINCGKKFGCDLNEYLIELLNTVKDKCNILPKEISEDEYKSVMNNIENYDKWYVGFVGFLCSFGGKFFGGYARGKNNNGDYRNYADESYRNLMKQSKNLKDITFKNCSFQDINTNISNFVIYCDPPYRGTTKYKTEEFPYEEFYQWCRNMAKNNIVLVSEYNMPNDFECIWSKETIANFDSNRKSNDDKNKRVEKLFIYKGEI